jgi:hypothetical protein
MYRSGEKIRQGEKINSLISGGILFKGVGFDSAIFCEFEVVVVWCISLSENSEGKNFHIQICCESYLVSLGRK